LSEECFKKVEKKREDIAQQRESLSQHFFYPTEETNAWFTSRGLAGIKDRTSAEVLLRRPEIQWKSLCDLGYAGDLIDLEVQEQVEIQVKYEGYIRRDMDVLEGIRKNEQLRVPLDLDFDQIPGLSSEIRGRLKVTRPESIGQVSRMPGVTPAAVANLMIYLKMQASKGRSASGLSEK